MKKLMRILFVLTLLFSTINLNVKAGSDNEFPTEDTFTSNGGEYSIEYILSNVGIFVEGNASSIHNNSPVIIGGSFGRFSDSQSIKNIKNGLEFNQNLLERVQTHDAIEFIENVPSYIADTALISGVQAHKNFYFGTKNALTIVKDNDSESASKYRINSNIDQSEEVHISLEGGSSLGKTDEYIDFSEAFSKLEKESLELLKIDSRVITDEDVISSDFYTIIEVEPGENITIPENIYSAHKDRLAIGYKTTEHLDTQLTVVNILGEEITIPYTLKLGEMENYDLIIENGYYPGHYLASDLEGKSINFIYNVPDALTVNLSNARNAYGHLVSPKATVYDEMGNFNGGVIAKNYYSRSETHFWPLKVDEAVPSPMTEYTVIKKWENVGNLDLPPIKVNLYRNGEVFKTIELDGSEDWTYTWTDLEKYDENGTEYTYTVDEVSVPEGFEKSVKGNVITNTYKEVEPEIEYIEYTVIKKWENVDNLDLPSIKVNLYRNREVHRTIELDGSEDWTYTWTDLEKYDENGIEYTYTVDEVSVPEGFEKSVEGNVITNTYTRNGEVLPATGISNMSLYSSVSMIVGGLYILFKKD